ncbi:hypothetical protein J4G08_13730 [Candidatus Poribacteria bacterium]|nr:hypothetical protein [Candidatus Poribacteria bacterium]
MKFEEKHKQFAVKCFAQFMTRKEVTSAFLEEFSDDLPQPPPMQQLPILHENQEQHSNDQEREDQLDKDEYFAVSFEGLREKYEYLYGNEADSKFNQDIPKLQEQIEDEYAQQIEKKRNRLHTQHLKEYHNQVNEHERNVRTEISNQIRRYNRTNPQFPQKYRELFNQTRNEYFARYRNESLKNDDNVTLELETLYGYIKQHIFETSDKKDATTNVRLAHNILKTIATHNLIKQNEQIADTKHQDTKALTDK